MNQACNWQIPSDQFVNLILFVLGPNCFKTTAPRIETLELNKELRKILFPDCISTQSEELGEQEKMN